MPNIVMTALNGLSVNLNGKIVVSGICEIFHLTVACCVEIWQWSLHWSAHSILETPAQTLQNDSGSGPTGDHFTSISSLCISRILIAAWSSTVLTHYVGHHQRVGWILWIICRRHMGLLREVLVQVEWREVRTTLTMIYLKRESACRFRVIERLYHLFPCRQVRKNLNNYSSSRCHYMAVYPMHHVQL